MLKVLTLFIWLHVLYLSRGGGRFYLAVLVLSIYRNVLSFMWQHLNFPFRSGYTCSFRPSRGGCLSGCTSFFLFYSKVLVSRPVVSASSTIYRGQCFQQATLDLFRPIHFYLATLAPPLHKTLQVADLIWLHFFLFLHNFFLLSLASRIAFPVFSFWYLGLRCSSAPPFTMINVTPLQWVSQFLITINSAGVFFPPRLYNAPFTLTTLAYCYVTMPWLLRTMSRFCYHEQGCLFTTHMLLPLR